MGAVLCRQRQVQEVGLVGGKRLSSSPTRPFTLLPPHPDSSSQTSPTPRPTSHSRPASTDLPLPSDLIDTILGILDPPSLATVARTSRSLFTLSIPHLYAQYNLIPLDPLFTTPPPPLDSRHALYLSSIRDLTVHTLFDSFLASIILSAPHGSPRPSLFPRLSTLTLSQACIWSLAHWLVIRPPDHSGFPDVHPILLLLAQTSSFSTIIINYAHPVPPSISSTDPLGVGRIVQASLIAFLHSARLSLTTFICYPSTEPFLPAHRNLSLTYHFTHRPSDQQLFEIFYHSSPRRRQMRNPEGKVAWSQPVGVDTTRWIFTGVHAIDWAGKLASWDLGVRQREVSRMVAGVTCEESGQEDLPDQPRTRADMDILISKS